MRPCNSQGFTLVELMLVVVLMGFTSVLGMSSYYRFMNDARLNSGGKAIAGWLDQIRRMAIQNSKICTVQINPATGTLQLVDNNPTIDGISNCDALEDSETGQQRTSRTFTFNLQETVGTGETVQLCARLLDPSQTFSPCNSDTEATAITLHYTPRGTTPDNALIELRSTSQSYNRCIAIHSPLGLIRLGRVLNNRCDWTSAW
jgi:prepilin-type N-terminal cleavage/methylation domain-containing protein